MRAIPCSLLKATSRESAAGLPSSAVTVKSTTAEAGTGVVTFGIVFPAEMPPIAVFSPGRNPVVGANKKRLMM